MAFKQMQTQLAYANGHDGLYADVSTTIERSPSRRPQYRCQSNYQIPVVTAAPMKM